MKLFAAGSIVVLGAALGAVPSLGSAAEPEPPTPGSCSQAELKRLKQLGDNFADACFLPGQELGEVDGVDSRLDEGDQDSLKMGLRAEVPFSESATEGEPSPFDEGSVGTDLAFKGDYAFAGNYEGLTVYDISDPGSPETVAQLDCPGPQNDISVYQDLLILSVDSRRTDDSCSSEAIPPGTPGVAWEGLRVVDISDPTSPEVVANVETDCGSHTHTLAPNKKGTNLFVYVSSYGPNPAFLDCAPPHDKISVVKVPVDDGAAAELVGTPVLFPDGGYEGSQGKSATSGCHDITAYPSKDIAAGACMGDGILMDISERAEPRVIEQVRDTTNFAFWHSATFNNAGTKVVFTDELGGGGAATCNNDVGQKRGADGIYDIVDRKNGPQLKFRSYYKIPRVNSNTENCVAHNGSLLPVKGRDIMVQAWYQGGISVFDFTDSSNPRELAWFDRGAISEDELVLGGNWSAYWYNGHVYASDITRGLAVYDIGTGFARKASKVDLSIFNAQSQPSYNG